MKKILAFVLALCLLCGATAFATSYGPSDNDAQTELKVTIDESYTVVIPATVNIPFEATSTSLPVEVTALRTYSTGTIANSVRALHVKAESVDNKLENQNGDTISYTISGGESQANMLYFTEVAEKAYTVSITEAAWDAAPAGSYTDNVTFEIWIANY